MSTPQPPVSDPYGQNPYGQVPQNPYSPGTGLQGGRPRPSVNFGQAFTLFFKNYAVFNGRASRSEYWWAFLGTYAVSAVLGGIANGVGDTGGTILSSLSGLWGLAILVPSLAICWRRLHDTGRSGGWWFIGLVPVVGWIILIVFLAGQSRPDAWQRFDNGKLPVES